MKELSAEEKRALDRIRAMPWSAHFHKTVANPTVPGGKVDMYLLIDDDTGESLVSLAVPHGQHWIAEYVAGCCADPYFVRENEKMAGDIAKAFNRALKPFFGKDESIDARDVHAGCMAMIEAYVGAMPNRSRQELIDATIKNLHQLRNKE
jgi:hypothetical protein